MFQCMKKMVSLLFFVSFLAIVTGQKLDAYSLKSDAKQYGFDVDDSQYRLIYMTQVYSSKYEIEYKGKIGAVVQVEYLFLVDKGSENTYINPIYHVAYRLTTTPYKVTYKGGLFNWFTYNAQLHNFQMITETQMRTGANLTDWSPKNTPGSSSIGVGVSLDSAKTFGVSASTEFVVKGLDIKTTVDRPRGYVKQSYQYNPPFFPWENSSYLRDSQEVFGFYTFNDPDTAWMDIDLDVNYLVFVNNELSDIVKFEKTFVK